MTAQPAVSPESLPVLAYQGARVVTTELLAQLYGTESLRVQQNYLRNQDRFEHGKHFFKLEGEALRQFKESQTSSKIVSDIHSTAQSGAVEISPQTRNLLLWTERGAARHAKMLDTEQAWDVFERLEDAYFRPTERLTMEAETAASSLLSRLADDFLNARELAEAVGFDGVEAILRANHVVYEIHGVSVLELPGAEHLFPEDAGSSSASPELLRRSPDRRLH